MKKMTLVNYQFGSLQSISIAFLEIMAKELKCCCRLDYFDRSMKHKCVCLRERVHVCRSWCLTLDHFPPLHLSAQRQIWAGTGGALLLWMTDFIPSVCVCEMMEAKLTERVLKSWFFQHGGLSLRYSAMYLHKFHALFCCGNEFLFFYAF